MKTSFWAVAGAPGVRVAAWGERTGRVNWGPSAAGGPVPQPGGIMHKPLGGRQRRRWGRSKRRADRTIEPVGEPRTPGPAVVVRNLRCRLDASPTTDQTPRTEIPTVTAYKPAPIRRRRWPWRQAGLKPYWFCGAPHKMREIRPSGLGGRGSTLCSSYPHRRAGAVLLDRLDPARPGARKSSPHSCRSASTGSISAARRAG